MRGTGLPYEFAPRATGRLAAELLAKSGQDAQRRAGRFAQGLMDVPQPGPEAMGFLGITPDESDDDAVDGGPAFRRVGGKRGRDPVDKPTIANPEALQEIEEALHKERGPNLEEDQRLTPGSDVGADTVKTTIRRYMATMATNVLPEWLPPESCPVDNPILMGLIAGDGHLMGARMASRSKRNLTDVYHYLLHSSIPVHMLHEYGVPDAAAPDAAAPDVPTKPDTTPDYLLVRGENGDGHGFDLLLHVVAHSGRLACTYVQRPKHVV